MESRQNVPAGMEIKIKMKIVETIAEVRAQVKEWRAQGLSVGLVPTMGYLHEGHKSLIDRAVAENDKVVVSVFVNPMQFGVGEDLESYPRDMERDSALCENAGAALIFHPQPEEMYHKDFSSFVDMNTLTKGLCGKTRPIHSAACVRLYQNYSTLYSRIRHISDRRMHSSLPLSATWYRI